MTNYSVRIGEIQSGVRRVNVSLVLPKVTCFFFASLPFSTVPFFGKKKVRVKFWVEMADQTKVVYHFSKKRGNLIWGFEADGCDMMVSRNYRVEGCSFAKPSKSQKMSWWNCSFGTLNFFFWQTKPRKKKWKTKRTQSGLCAYVSRRRVQFLPSLFLFPFSLFVSFFSFFCLCRSAACPCLRSCSLFFVSKALLRLCQGPL